MTEHPDFRSETARMPGAYKSPPVRGDYRNVYRRADGSERHGCTWHDRDTAEAARETLAEETFVELRDMRNAQNFALVGVTAPVED